MPDTDDITVLQGDRGYQLSFTLYDSAGSARDMTGYDAAFKVWDKGDPTSLQVDSACSWTVQASGTCTYLVQEGDFDTKGRYYYAIEATKSGVIETCKKGELIVEGSA